jgi:hypothetical protein
MAMIGRYVTEKFSIYFGSGTPYCDKRKEIILGLIAPAASAEELNPREIDPPTNCPTKIEAYQIETYVTSVIVTFKLIIANTH